jgi:hypothetical protein
MGAKVIAVSKDNWIKTDFGADYIISRMQKKLCKPYLQKKEMAEFY